MLADAVQRTLPKQPHDPETHEFFHESLKKQSNLSAAVLEKLNNPDFVAPLEPLEEQMKSKWPYDPNSHRAKAYKQKLQQQQKDSKVGWVRTILRSVSGSSSSVRVAGSDGSVTVESTERRRTIKSSIDIFSLPRNSQRPQKN